MSTQKLLRVSTTTLFHTLHSHQENSTYVNPKTAPFMTTTLFHVWHSHQDNSAYCQPKNCSVYWPPHCFTLDVAIKRTLLTAQNYTVYQPQHCVSPDTFRYSRRLSERRQTAVHCTCWKSCDYWGPTLQGVLFVLYKIGFYNDLRLWTICRINVKTSFVWSSSSVPWLDLTGLDLTWASANRKRLWKQMRQYPIKLNKKWKHQLKWLNGITHTRSVNVHRYVHMKLLHIDGVSNHSGQGTHNYVVQRT